MASVGVIGSGAWGTTLALLLANSDTKTILWEYKSERAVEMQQRRENMLFLPGFRFPDMLKVTSDIKEAVRERICLYLLHHHSACVRMCVCLLPTLTAILSL